MASSEFSLHQVLPALKSPGFYCQKDSAVGERAAEPFEDIDQPAGLQFCERNFLNDEVSDAWTVDSCFDIYWLIHSSEYQEFSSISSQNAISWRIERLRRTRLAYFSSGGAAKKLAAS